MALSLCDSMSSGSDIPFLGPRVNMELQELTRKPKRNRSLTLGELLQRVGDANSDTPPHHALRVDPEPAATSPFILSFDNLTYSVKAHRRFSISSCLPTRSESEKAILGAKVLLNNISGEAREGEIMAVLGASGSGKSTLIDALANRIAKGKLKGSVRLNGESLESRLLKVISAYVMQDDLLFPMLTVEETLMFSAEFRLPRTLSKSKKRQRVQELIDQLGLRSAAKTIIGDEGHRGVSGGERRRVSIGIDIIHNPIVLFLDEPTSGLDSTSAFMVVKVLQRIAQSGSIVIMSIHQPSYRIMGLLDHLIFLSRGQMVFSDTPSNMPAFLSEFGHPIPENEDQTEFTLDFIRELETSPGGTKGLVDFNRSWGKRQSHRRRWTEGPKMSLKDAISASISKGKLVSGATNVPVDSRASSSVATFANPYWVEMIVLSKRSLLNSWRSPELYAIRLGAVLVTATIFATVFRHLDDSPQGIKERVGFFAIAMTTMFYTCAEAIPVFLQQRYIFMRETAYNAYRRSSFVVAHSILSIPSLVFLSFAFAAITFWSVGLSGGLSGFFLYLLFIFSSFWVANSFVTFLSGVVSHVMLGFTVVMASLAYLLLFSGFFITRDRIPVYWLWFHYLSLVKYPYEGALQNELSDPGKCFVKGIQVFDNSPLGAFPDSVKLKLLNSISHALNAKITNSTCMVNGQDILKTQGVTDISQWNCLWITIGLGFFFRILFYFALLLGSKNKRS